MVPMLPTPFNKVLTGAAGFIVGIAAQYALVAFIAAVVGPITSVWSWEMLLFVLILLLPPILSYKFLEVTPGSIKENFIRGIQFGVLFGFIVGLYKIFP